MPKRVSRRSRTRPSRPAKRSRSRQEESALCRHFGTCGGCTSLNVSYPQQLEQKTRELRAALGEFALFSHESFEISPSPRTHHYRAKTVWPVERRKHQVRTGFYVAGTHELIDTLECQTQDPAVTKVLRAARAATEELGLSVREERTGQGFVRAFFARLATGAGHLQLGLVTQPGLFEEAAEWAAAVREHVGSLSDARGRAVELKSIVRNLNDTQGNRLLGHRTTPIAGPDVLMERFGRLTLRLSMTSFFQVNPYAALKMVQVLEGWVAELKPRRTLECYAGVGTLALAFAEHLEEVFAIEVEGAAARDAVFNFEAADLGAQVLTGTILERLPEVSGPIDLAIVDPPRTGLGPEVLAALLERGPEHVLYVSCNAKSLRRDLGTFTAGGYEVRRARGFDLFPHTPHVEVAALLSRGELPDALPKSDVPGPFHSA